MDLPDFTEVEVRATAQERLDLHFEHLDALSVERGSRSLAEHLRGFGQLQARIGEHVVSGELVCVGDDWVQLSNGLVSLTACEELVASGTGEVPVSRLAFRQVLRHYAGRVPREILVAGRLQLLIIEWVGADFVSGNRSGRQVMVPLGQIGGVFGGLG